MEGLSGSERAAPNLSIGALCAPARTAYARTGWEMFLSCSSPRSSKPTSKLAFDFAVHLLGIRMPARIGNPLQPDSNGDPIAVEITILPNGNVTKVLSPKRNLGCYLRKRDDPVSQPRISWRLKDSRTRRARRHPWS